MRPEIHKAYLIAVICFLAVHTACLIGTAMLGDMFLILLSIGGMLVDLHVLNYLFALRPEGRLGKLNHLK